MVKRAIAAMLSMVMLLGVFSGLTISAQAANTRNVTLFGDGADLAEGVTWTGEVQTGSRQQLKYKNSEKNAVLTFTADVTDLEKIIVNAASNYAESYSVTINGVTGSAVESAANQGWGDRNIEIPITTTVEGEQTITITDVTEETYINSVTLKYSSNIPEEPDTTSIQIKSVLNDKVIDVTASGTDNGNIVIAADATDSASQKWTLTPGTEKGWYYIVNKNSGKGIGMSGGTTDAGAQPVQWDCNGSANQFWRFVEVKKGENTYYKILNKNSKRVLTINEAKVTQEDWTGADNQLWSMDPEANLPQDFASKYDDDYAVTNISATAADGEISYKVIYTMQEGMTLKVELSKEGSKVQVLETEDGTFNTVEDGEYTITACVYSGENKVCEELTKTITLTGGAYTVVGADWICSTEQNMYADKPVISLPLSDAANTRNGNSVRMGYTPWNDDGGVGLYIDNLEIRDGVLDNKRIYSLGDGSSCAAITGTRNTSKWTLTTSRWESTTDSGKQRFLLKPADIQNIYAVIFRSTNIENKSRTIDIYACAKAPDDLGTADLTQDSQIFFEYICEKTCISRYIRYCCISVIIFQEFPPIRYL